MMNSKTNNYRWLLHLLGAAILLTSLVACSSTEDPIDDIEKPQPETPIADGDWQAVPATGGTIEKGDIAITFPSGTFSKDTKVAISDVNKGATVGADFEASKFYRIKMPVTTHKPTTIKIKSAQLGDDVQFLMESKGFARSAGVSSDVPTILETTYSNGGYTVTLPVFDNKDESISEVFTIGLSHIPTLKANTRGDGSIAEGEVKGVKWKLYIEPKAVNYPGSSGVIYNPVVVDAVKKRINEAITKIRNLGFEIRDKKRVIPYYFAVPKNNKDPLDQAWGTFVQDWWDDSSSKVRIGINKMIAAPNDTMSNRSTIIHETFHYFQADYDPRCSWTKAKASDNEDILNEMGAVWSEQFVNDGQLIAAYLRNQVFNGVFYVKGQAALDALGMGDEKTRWISVKENVRNQQQGYSMGPLLYYITTQLGGFGFNNSSVVELHKLVREKWKDRTHNSYFILDDWVRAHDSGLLTSYTIDDYYMMLWKGELVKDFSITDILGGVNSNVIKDSNKKIDISGTLFPFGCAARRIVFRGFKDISLQDKELVIKQLDDKAHSYVIVSDTTSKFRKFLEVKKNGERRVIAGGDSIVLSGSTLESLRLADGRFEHVFYVITTNIANAIHSTEKKNFNVTVELRDKKKEASVSPKALTFPAEGGTQTLTVTSKGYNRYNHTISFENKSDAANPWLSGKNNSGGKLEVTALPNTTGKKRVAYVKAFVFNEDKPNDKVYLDSVKVTQEANDKQDDDSQSAYKIASGNVSMYYAIEWKWEVSFKSTDENVTITPKGKGANVVIQQAGTDFHAEWKSTISFDIDDLSLSESGKAKLSNYSFEMVRDGWDATYGWSHSDWSKTTTKLTSTAPVVQQSANYWRISPEYLKYNFKQTIHYDKWKKDYYAEPVENATTDVKTTVTDGSYVTIGLYVQKK